MKTLHLPVEALYCFSFHISTYDPSQINSYVLCEGEVILIKIQLSKLQLAEKGLCYLTDFVVGFLSRASSIDTSKFTAGYVLELLRSWLPSQGLGAHCTTREGCCQEPTARWSHVGLVFVPSSTEAVKVPKAWEKHPITQLLPPHVGFLLEIFATSAALRLNTVFKSQKNP